VNVPISDEAPADADTRDQRHRHDRTQGAADVDQRAVKGHGIAYQPGSDDLGDERHARRVIDCGEDTEGHSDGKHRPQVDRAQQNDGTKGQRQRGQRCLGDEQHAAFVRAVDDQAG
jgi:hypothetical protein